MPNPSSDSKFAAITAKVAAVKRSPLYTYPKELGPKRLVLNIDESVGAIRNSYPSATGGLVEGSGGLHRSYWYKGRRVAHAWQVKPTTRVWLRVLTGTMLT